MHGFLHWWPEHHDENLGHQLFLTDERFECDWNIWIFSGNQFANHMQKTGPKSDIFHGFWSVFLMKFDKITHTPLTHAGAHCTPPHAYFLIHVQKSHFHLLMQICLHFVYYQFRCLSIPISKQLLISKQFESSFRYPSSFHVFLQYFH